MARQIPVSKSTRIWPRPDARRTAGVITYLDMDAGCGHINWCDYQNSWEGEDVPFFAQDCFGDFSAFQPGQTVSFRLEGGLALEIANIHRPDSEQSFLTWQLANGF